MEIFLSHIHEEVALARKLQELIRETFPDGCEVFVSSDYKSIPPGTKWKDKLKAAMESSDLVIVLASPRSISRPWVNFEAGGGWFTEKDILAICHSGQEKSALPPPLDDFNALEISDPNFIRELMDGLAGRMGIRLNRIDAGGMTKDLLEAADSAAKSGVPSAEPAKIASSSARDEIPEVEQRILLFLADADDRQTLAEIAQAFKMHPEKMKWHLDRLKDQELVFDELNMLEPTRYFLKRGGRDYLVELGLL